VAGGFYLVGNRVTAATVVEPLACLWNPSSTLELRVLFLSLIGVGGTPGQEPLLRRSTTRGTPGSTITPDIDNHSIHELAPPSGALLDLADYSVVPTVDASTLMKFLTPQSSIAQGPGKTTWFREPGITIPPSTGLIVDNVGGASIWDISFWWEE
jgi:hypothetical protein